MRGVNKVILLGTLGRDPEVRTFAGGGSITTVSLATSEQWKDKQTGENKEQTEWHRVVFSNRLAEIAAEYLRKGSKAYVEGKLTTRKWTDKDGQEKYSTEIRADTLQRHQLRPIAATCNAVQFLAQQSAHHQSSNNAQVARVIGSEEAGEFRRIVEQVYLAW